MDHATRLNDGGYPAGGTTKGVGIEIRWQSAVRPRDADGRPTQPKDGAEVEDVLEAALGRLEFYQTGPLGCPENKTAINAVKGAITALGNRAKARVKAGLSGVAAEKPRPKKKKKSTKGKAKA